MDSPLGMGSSGPLAGVRVLDLTSVFFGPYCTRLLGDMGADVVKVEPPQGDIVRRIGPSRNADMGAIHLGVNRNKRSLVLDLRNERGRASLLRLAEGADVFIHNVRPKAIARLRLDYDDVAAVRPDIVYCTACGYGQGGPYSDFPAYDDVVQGAAGIAAVQSHGKPDMEYVNTVVADKTSGLAAASAIAMALFHRERTGEGQAIEVPMFETMAAYLLLEQQYGLTFEPAIGGPVYPRSTSPDRRPYRTADGHICIVVYNDTHWKRFFELAGRSDLAADPRFVTIAGRTENIDELYRLVSEIMPQRSTADWLQALLGADIPAMALNTVEDLLADPHLNAAGLFELHEHPTEGAIRTIGVPVKFSKSPGGVERLAPTLGQHSREVLVEAGFESSEIDALHSSGVTSSPAADQST